MKNTILRIVVALLVLGGAPWTATAQNSNGGQTTARQRSAAKTPATAVRELKLSSKLLARELPYSVVVPANYDGDKSRRFPTIYLLHGFGGNYTNYASFSNLAELAAKHSVIVVSVEGKTGWYTDSATQQNEKFESYIVQELIPEVDRTFRTVNERRGRAIAGLSMGGYGAVKFGIKYPERFALAAAMSGAFNVPKIPIFLLSAAGREIQTVSEAVYGADNSETRQKNDVYALVNNLSAEQIKALPFIYLDCGTEDFIFGHSTEFAAALVKKKVAHEFRQLPGAHNAPYWTKQLPEIFEVSERTFNQPVAVAATAR